VATDTITAGAVPLPGSGLWMTFTSSEHAVANTRVAALEQIRSQGCFIAALRSSIDNAIQ
jgi:hypothetical protein